LNRCSGTKFNGTHQLIYIFIFIKLRLSIRREADAARGSTRTLFVYLCIHHIFDSLLILVSGSLSHLIWNVEFVARMWTDHALGAAVKVRDEFKELQEMVDPGSVSLLCTHLNAH
jgi:hypothetical protein